MIRGSLVSDPSFYALVGKSLSLVSWMKGERAGVRWFYIQQDIHHNETQSSSHATKPVAYLSTFPIATKAEQKPTPRNSDCQQCRKEYEIFIHACMTPHKKLQFEQILIKGD
jgi:hypothetical protein